MTEIQPARHITLSSLSACLAATLLVGCAQESAAPVTPSLDVVTVVDTSSAALEVLEETNDTLEISDLHDGQSETETVGSCELTDSTQTDTSMLDGDTGPMDMDVAEEDSEVDDLGSDGPGDGGFLDIESDASDANETTDTLADTEDTAPPVFECTDTEQLELYSVRIEPLVSGNAVSSCNQCHLSGIDLSIYVKGSPCETMACMIAQGFVDLESPEMSAVLSQILQADPQSALITSEVIEEEYEGFLEWIQFSSSCHEEVCGDVPDACGGGPSDTPNVPGGVLTPLGSCEEEALIDLFDDRVYEWRGRCHGCHDDCENEEWEAPCWLVNPGDEATPEELKEAAALSMYNLIGIDAFDPYDPPASLALLKPMAETMGGVEHGGGEKFYDFADLAYQDYMVFALQYGACYQGVEPWWPTVTILEPANKSKFYENEPPPVLSGTATDPQDGVISDNAAYIWTRFIEGEADQVLATGPGPHEIVLPLGKHILTLTVTDSEGNSASRSIKVWIKTQV